MEVKAVEEEQETKITTKTKTKERNLLELPEGCLSHILSLTSPIYVLRSALVCKSFSSLSKSDLVWHNFLPLDFHHLLNTPSNTSSTPLSTKQLVLHLCRSFVRPDGGNLSFSLDKWTAKKCFMLGAKELTIASGDNPRCWRWEPMSESRFPEVAELLGVSQLQITGKISTQLLSPNTTYHAYFSFKLRPWSLGFDVCPVKVSVSSIDPRGAYIKGKGYSMSKTFYLKAPESNILDIVEDDYSASVHPRDDRHRWVKIDMGKHLNRATGDVAVLEMSLTGVDTTSYKSGLIVHGIELLPHD